MNARERVWTIPVELNAASKEGQVRVTGKLHVSVVKTTRGIVAHVNVDDLEVYATDAPRPRVEVDPSLAAEAEREAREGQRDG